MTQTIKQFIMKTTEINSTNFDDTIQETIQSMGDLYLDRHLLNGKDYWTVSCSDKILAAYDKVTEALEHYCQELESVTKRTIDQSFKIFRIKERSITDQWETMDYCSHILHDDFDPLNFESQTSAALYLSQNGDKEESYTILPIYKLK